MPGPKVRKIDVQAALASIKGDPRINLPAVVKEAKRLAREKGVTTGRGPDAAIDLRKAGDKCGGCFGCLACGASPTPDIEVACITTVVYFGS